MSLQHVRLTLARNQDFPSGSPRHGYDLVVPLDAEGMLDAEAWKAHPKSCKVRRFWADEEERHGLLRHIGRGWVIDYDATTREGDEPFFKLDRHSLKAGEYVSVTEQDGELLTFRVDVVEPV